jgi:hypothetical protein
VTAKAATRQAIAGNCDRGPLDDSSKTEAPGVLEARRVDARRVDTILGARGTARRRSRDKGVKGGCPRSLGVKPKKLPGECGPVKGGKTRRTSESSPTPDNRTRAPTGNRGHRPARSPLCLAQGDRKGSHQSSRCVVKRTLARGTFDGLRSAEGPRATDETGGAEKHARIVANRSRGDRRRSRSASHRSDWVLVRGGRSVEVDETRLSCRSDARACASRGRTIARLGRSRSGVPRKRFTPDQLLRLAFVREPGACS